MRSPRLAAILAPGLAICLALGVSFGANAQTTTPAAPAKPVTPMATTAPAPAPAPTPAPAPMAKMPMATMKMVNINTATPAELDALPQIGKARTKAIIAGRPYASTQDLVTKKVLSQGVFNKIKDKISVN